MMKKITTITLSIFTILLISCSGESNRQKTPEELKVELKQQELLNPVKYLESKNVTMQEQTKKVKNAGLFRSAEYASDGAIIEGQILNTATLAKYKDVVVKISYYSQTETLIDEKSYVIYEFYKPNSSKKFLLKVNPPKAYKSYNFQLTDAKSVYE